MRPRTLGIIGLGPLGQCLGRQAIEAGVGTVLGWSVEPAARVAAVCEGAAHDAPSRVEEVARAAELLVLAVDSADAIALLPRLVPHLGSGTLLTDTAVVKLPFVRRAGELPCAGQTAGSHVLGPVDTRGCTALRDSLVYVTPVPGGDGAAREIAHFWNDIYGAAPVVIDAERHDAQAALTHQLPLLAAASLAATLRRHLPPGTALGTTARELTRAAGLGDRVAGDAWANRELLAAALRGLAAETLSLVEALQGDTGVAFRQRLADVAQWRALREGPE